MVVILFLACLIGSPYVLVHVLTLAGLHSPWVGAITVGVELWMVLCLYLLALAVKGRRP